MRQLTVFLLSVFIATAAAAQVTTKKDAQPDFSRPALLRLFSDQRTTAGIDHGLTFRAGSVEFHAVGTRWRVAYLPLMMPLPGTAPTTTRQYPDAFSLTGTPIATSSSAYWRSVSRERRRQRAM